MHTLKDARVFVESLNHEQKRALSTALLMSIERWPENDHVNLLATRLCEAILLARTVSHIGRWKHS